MRTDRRKTRMNKKILFITIAILLSGAVAAAEEQQRDIGVTLDVTYLSKYIDKGGRYFGNLFASTSIKAADTSATRAHLPSCSTSTCTTRDSAY